MLVELIDASRIQGWAFSGRELRARTNRLGEDMEGRDKGIDYSDKFW